jgi:hypothetical protein
VRRPAPEFIDFRPIGHSGCSGIGTPARSTGRKIWSRFGSVRGDLWSESAYTYAAPLWPGAEPDSDPLIAANDVRAVVEQALKPSHMLRMISSIWLLAARLTARLEWRNSDADLLLKMSYYAGPNEIDLLPLRLLTATRSNALSDGDIQRPVQRDVRMILTR